MSQFTKSLEKRIQELTASIDAQKTELAAYERVLHMEVSKDSAPAEMTPVAEEAASEASHPTPSAPVESKPAAEPSTKVSSLSFTGNKTSMVAEIVKTYGSAGATPKEVDAFFTARNIERSKNLIYNTLSYLVAQKKLVRRDGKYFTIGVGSAPAKKTSASAVAAPTKRRLSPEGLKRIKEALKKRWAAKRAAEAASGKPATKTAAKKK